jgi:hypothetical protein
MDGNRPKRVELIGIINKPLMLHPVGCLYYFVIHFTVQRFTPFRALRFVAMGMKTYKLYQIRNQEFVSVESCSISYLDPQSDTFPSLQLPYP